MNKEIKNIELPTLRFPEFNNTKGWELTTLVKLAKFRRGSFPQPYGLPKWYDEINGIPFIQVYDVGEDFRLKTKTKSKISKLGAEQSVFIPKGTVIITIQGSIGRVAITQYDAYIDRTLLLFEDFYKPINKTFFAYVLFLLFEIEKLKAPGGIIKTITKEVLSDFNIYVPSIDEQQKIADCLSSLDDLITAETQKLDALKDHKKGLMQQLFPGEGEMEPKLRFEEFKNDLKLVGFAELGEIKIGLTHTPKYIESGIPFLSSKNISKGYIDFENVQYISEEEFSEMTASARPKIGDILFTRVGSNLCNPIVLQENIEFGIFVSLGIFRVNKKASNFYIKYWMETDWFWVQLERKVAGGAKNNLNTNWLKEFELYIPSLPEQNKIAECLSSMDKLITAQTKNVEKLKKHKHGLMQGLFPKIE